MGILAMLEFAFRKDIRSWRCKVLNVTQPFPDFCITGYVKHPVDGSICNAIIDLAKASVLEYVMSMSEDSITVSK